MIIKSSTSPFHGLLAIKPLPSRQVVGLRWSSRVIPIEKSSNNDILFYKGNITNYFKEILFRVMTKDFCWSSFLRPVISQPDLRSRRYCWLISYRGFGFSVSCANHVPELDLGPSVLNPEGVRSLCDLTRRALRVRNQNPRRATRVPDGPKGHRLVRFSSDPVYLITQKWT